MKKIAVFSVLAVLFLACGQQAKKAPEKTEDAPAAAIVLTVDELLQQASELVDKEVIVKGTVFHVCQQGGERCFLMGSSEDISIRIEAGEKIGAFTQEQMGSELEIVGILKEVKTEADAHNPGAEHGEGEATEDTETAKAHQIIAENQEAAERVFFVEGLKVKEL
ncbi:hypothetical protein [Maribellus sp. YY47]|uniref:hypothetical protein n=1 Tax=Maribellus sp. YY47 TaxID=2929486 RepID=UPI0020011F04|nr:hypothetical protein [Maribellus sp. YY47]MCK3685298.1 hypothetical protein [Maribellus sp. YY47]